MRRDGDVAENVLGLVRSSLKVVVVVFLCLAIFIAISYFLIGEGATTRGLILSAPDDWLDGLKLALAAIVASAVSTFICRHPYGRPIAMAIAAGLIFLNLDPLSVWDHVRKLVQVPPELPKGISSILTGFSEEEWDTFRNVAILRRARVYWIYYLGYMFWTVVALYSGYLGQYLAGLRLFKVESRRESALYFAENAGVGLVASIAAGLLAMVLAAGLVSIALPEGPKGVFGSSSVAVRTAEPGHADAAQRQSSSDSGKPAAAGSAVAAQPDKTAPPMAGLRLASFPPFSQRHRIYFLLVALAFFVTAYVTALSVRPRTSTWVACGAIVGVMLLPAVAAKWLIDPDNPGAFFAVLEMSPFALAGTAVASGLAGDWAAKTLLAQRVARTQQVYRPL